MRDFYFPDIGEPARVNPADFGGSGIGSAGGGFAGTLGGGNLGIPVPSVPAPVDIASQIGSEYGYRQELGGYRIGSDYEDPDFSEPIILDLDGNGARIETLQTSRIYFDMAGNGGRNRTAWAAAGDGVLAIDANNDGKINQRSEVVFTDWAEMAGNDMQAVRMVFDTNNSGSLDSGDARWGEFRVVKDGAVYTLAQLGITFIGLNGDGMTADLPDGSQIQTSRLVNRVHVCSASAYIQ